MKFSVSIYKDEDGMYIAECPAIPGYVSQGRTEDEAQANVADAIRECLAVRAEKGLGSDVRVSKRRLTAATSAWPGSRHLWRVWLSCDRHGADRAAAAQLPPAAVGRKCFPTRRSRNQTGPSMMPKWALNY
jgi:predicted RNase H-like HicB family nuclease